MPRPVATYFRQRPAVTVLYSAEKTLGGSGPAAGEDGVAQTQAAGTERAAYRPGPLGAANSPECATDGG